MIALNYRAHKGGGAGGVEMRGEYGIMWGEGKSNADHEGMVQPSQQHVVMNMLWNHVAMNMMLWNVAMKQQ